MNHQVRTATSWVSTLMLILTLICSNVAEAAPFLSDDFNPITTESNPAWNFYDPYDTDAIVGNESGESTLTLDGNNALIGIPAGLSHDLWVTPNNKAPRYLQVAEDTDFKIEVKFETIPRATSQSQGIIVQQDNDTFLRFDIFYGNATKLFVAFIDGAANTIHLPTTSLQNSPKYQQVERVGDLWTFRYSDDGTVWTDAVTFTESNIVVTEVGFFAGTSGSNPEFLSSVDYFMDVDNPITDSDTWIAPAPEITTWYGYDQPSSFGQPGITQTWANILGNVFSNTNLTTLTYKLNGGLEQTLPFGPDTKRLLGIGDFNIEIDPIDLTIGSNSVEIKAIDINGSETMETVNIDYSLGSVWPFPHTVDWQSITDIQDIETIAHIVDGKWTLVSGGIQSLQRGYDRTIAIGDKTWSSNYEVTVPFTLQTSSFNGVGFGIGWQGHEGSQSPKIAWPVQALVWVRGQSNDLRLEILRYDEDTGGEEEVVSVPLVTPAVVKNQLYKLKASSEPLNDGSGLSKVSMKFWLDSDGEPNNWDINANVPSRDGSILLVAWSADVTFGNVIIEPLSGNQPPTAVATGTPTSGEVPLDVNFDGSGSIDDGTITAYAWDFGDGSPESNQVSPTHTYTASGNYISTLTVTDDGGLTDTDTVSITVNDPVGNQPPTAVATGIPTSGEAPLDVNFDGSGSTDDGTITYVWDFGDGSPISTAINPTHTFVASGNYTVTLTVTDDGSLTDTDTVSITVGDIGNSSGMVSDDFNHPLNTGVWTFYDPIGDSTLSETGTQMDISVPAETSHDLWTNALFAPRILQAANDTDFEIEVKFDSVLSDKYQLQGITVEQDNSNLLRFDFYSDGSKTQIFSASFINGIPTQRIKTVITDGVPLYLRVTRAGDQWTMSYSYDGANWIVGGVYTHNLSVASVGIFGGNAGSTPPAHSALIDYFKVNGDDPSGNQAPTVDAGVDQTITLPNDATLAGTVSDDGEPNPPGAVTTLWTVLSGPGTVTFGDDTQVATTASFSLDGTYELNLTADDGELTASDPITITVNAAGGSNVAPTVDAGVDQTITLPNDATLAGTVSDDGEPNPPGAVTTLWTVLSGPGTVTFGDDTQVATTASFSLEGTYELNLAADDSELTTNDPITITVNAAGGSNVAPTVDAGVDQTITLPNDATLAGTVSDDGEPNPPGAVTTLWTVLSGPGTVTFGDDTQVATTASFSLDGTYELNLAADDGELTANDPITITVNATTGSGDLLGHWTLDDGSGVTASDSSGNDNNGVLTNGPIWNGSELVFDGHDDYLNIGTLDVSGSELTLTGWVQANQLENCASRDCRILSKASGTGTQDHYWMLGTIQVGDATRLRFRLKANGSTKTLIASTGNITNGDQFHVAAVYDGATMRLYKDGIEVGSVAKTGSINTNSAVEAWIGGNPIVATARPWEGTIANVRIYRKALTAGEVSAVKNSDEVIDTTSPLFSDIQVSATESTATITWDTSEVADGELSYGSSNAYENGTVSDENMGVSHSVTLTGLIPDTTYHYQLDSTDVNGNSTTSGNLTFTTFPVGGGPDLLIYDLNGIVEKSERGFPRDEPPLASANGDWTTPVNYAEGTLHVRAEVRNQPVAHSMLIQLCVWQYNLTLENCAPKKLVEGTAGFVRTWQGGVTSMFKKNGVSIDWVNPRQRYGLAIKHSDGVPISDINGWNWAGLDPDEVYPLDMRFTVVVVPKGQTFSGWENFID